MDNKFFRATTTCLILLFSSLAGCTGLEEDAKSEDIVNEISNDSNQTVNLEKYFSNKKIMVSTFHVGELVRAVTGDLVTIDYISQNNEPAHDIDPSGQDIIRLKESDMFFYHGLNLESWIEEVKEKVGEDMPPTYQTHAMPSGEIDIAYESLLVDDLCSLLASGETESNNLMSYESQASQVEIHAEKLAHVLTFPDADDGHDGHDHDNHDNHDNHDDHNDTHDDHNDTHDDHNDTHDDHENHNHMEPEKVISDVGHSACPQNTEVFIFHLEEGEYTVEFETSSLNKKMFGMAASPMLGGHAHHHDHGGEMCHNTDTHVNYNSTEEECENAGHMWSGDDNHGDHNDTHDDHSDHNDTHDDHSDHNDTHDDHNVLNNGTRGYLTIHIEQEGDYGFALPNGISMFILNDESHAGHDHGAHGGGDNGEMCHNTETHVNYVATEEECENAGHMWTGEESHDENIESDLEAEEDASEYDPHSWLDPLAFKAQVKVVLGILVEKYPVANETFTINAESYILSLDRLHIDYDIALGSSSNCNTRIAVSNHNAYSYLSQRYDIQFVSIHGIDPEGEPTAENLLKAKEKINEESISTIFIEEYTLASAVDGIVQDTGVDVLYLYTMEIRPSDDTNVFGSTGQSNSSDDYLSLMNKNLESLKLGLGCT